MDPMSENPLAPVRGILYGLLFSAVLWAPILVILYLAVW